MWAQAAALGSLGTIDLDFLYQSCIVQKCVSVFFSTAASREGVEGKTKLYHSFFFPRYVRFIKRKIWHCFFSFTLLQVREEMEKLNIIGGRVER